MTLLVPLGPASPVAEEMEEAMGLEVPEEAVGASDTQTLSVPSAPGASTPTYIMVPRCRTFRQAQSFCALRYRGKLASIHSASTNAFLVRLVHRLSNAGLVWIGAVSDPAYPPRVPSLPSTPLGTPYPVPRVHIPFYLADPKTPLPLD
ncbi:eosinophil granule major basic protein 1-like [Corapipo altera]|uniref:eosinophil granule major basic protein 1-like n=1 Tax=Corapipo altera TaxID=415028 RepID=UPI000FD64959|nr:eosinophil granule major basic protein 1-like [Corapipo altera]